MFPISLASIVLTLSVCQLALAQTSSRSSAVLANHSDPPVATSGAKDRRPASSQSKAEAKRLYKEAVKYIRGGFPRQAIQILSRVIELDPEYADAYYGLGFSFFEMGEWQKASDSLRELLRLIPNDADGQSLLDRSEEARKRAGTIEPTAKSITTNSESAQPQGASIGNNASSPVETSSEPKSVADDLTATYRVGSGDVLDVRFTDDSPNNSTLFTVTSLGLLEHPSLPDPLPVAGFTVEEITIQLRADLKRRGLNDNPSIRVAVRDYGSHAILVSGLVKESGTKILRREAIPLYVVVADAQPLPEAARLTLVSQRSKEVLTIDLTDTKEMERLVLPGDVITVQPNVVQFFYVSGEVTSPGEKTFRRGVTLTQALMIAGGLTKKAKEARISRDGGTGFLSVTQYKLKDIDSGKLRDPLIQPGDRITIVD
jgi:protein involved in polysaccharide export with SLBB domain